MNHDEDDIFLPTIPISEPSLPTAPSTSFNCGRKRPFLSSRQPSSFDDQLVDAINNSSDPALFSNDETPDAENYSPGMKRRKKRTYEGTWWGEKLEKVRASRRQSSQDTIKKRRFRRNFDSGIFMVDDSSSTDLSSDSLLDNELLRATDEATLKEEKPHAPESRVPSTETKPKVHRSFKFTTEAALRRMPQGRPINPKDHLIRKVAQNCLDNNDENVDWSNMGLDYLPPAITDLKSMIKRINPEIPSTNLAPFETELKVYLANNDFSRFPQHLLELTNIQLLSVRQNKLSELPPGIRSLINLQELNLSSNSLHYLPWEVFQLSRHHNLRIIREALNPWMPVPKPEDRFSEAPMVSLFTAKDMVLHRHVVSKPIEFLPDGSSQVLERLPRPSNNVSHLSEMILRALLRHNTSKADLSSYLSNEHPQSARNLLNTLREAQTSGGRVCTFCNRDMVLPRYQWYEWWNVSNERSAGGHFVRSPSTLFFNPRTDEQKVERYYNLTDNIDPNDEIDEVLFKKLLPFQRMACGCTDVKTGMMEEVKKTKEMGLPFEHAPTAFTGRLASIR